MEMRWRKEVQPAAPKSKHKGTTATPENGTAQQGKSMMVNADSTFAGTLPKVYIDSAVPQAAISREMRFDISPTLMFVSLHVQGSQTNKVIRQHGLKPTRNKSYLEKMTSRRLAEYIKL